MDLGFAELLRNFVPLGISDDVPAVSETDLLKQVVPPGRRVLEVCRGQALTSALVDAESLCQVDPVEFLAADTWSTYDVVILSDVLGYVRDPADLLRTSTRVLVPGGFVAAVMPNFGYGAVRLALLSGAYHEVAHEQETDPRLHFFTLKFIERLMVRAGYRIDQILRRVVPWDGVLDEVRYSLMDEGIVNQIRRDAEHSTLTYVVKCVPVSDPAHAAPDKTVDPDALKRQLDIAEAELQAALALNEELREAGRALREEAALLRRPAQMAGRLQKELNSALRDLSSAFAVRDDLIGRAHVADATLTDLLKKRSDLEASVLSLQMENSRLATRAGTAERIAVDLAQDLNARIDAKDHLLSELSKSRAEFEATLHALRSQNAQLMQRVESAEQKALELANELLEASKIEVQQLSELIDVVQRSRWWSLKRFFARLRGLLVR